MWDSPCGIEWDEGGCAMKLDRTSMLYGTLLLTGTGLLSQALGFLYRICLSRLIGAEVMGLYQLVMPVYSVLLSVTAVGLTAAVSNLSAEYHARGDRGAVSALLRRCLALFLALAALAAAIVIPFSDSISVYLLGDARTRLGLVLLLPCVLLTGVENLHKHYFYGTGCVRPPAAVELCEQLIRAGAVLGLLVLFLPQTPERTVGLIVLGMTACELFSALTLLVLARRSLAGAAPLPGGPDGRALTRRAVSIALPVGLTSLLGNLMGAATSVLIPQQLVRAGAEVGAAMSAFGVMCGMTLPMLSLPTAFIGALGLNLVPRLARAAALGQRELVRRQLDRALQAVSALVLPSMALLAALGPALGRLLFREPTAGDHLPLLAAGVALSCWQAVLSGALNGLGRQKAAARNALLSAVAELGGTWFLMSLPGVGLAGYAAAFVLSGGLGAWLNWRAVKAAAGLHARPFPWLIAPGLAAGLARLAAHVLFHALTLRWGLGDPAALGASAALGTVLYLAALQAQGVWPLRAGRAPA